MRALWNALSVGFAWLSEFGVIGSDDGQLP